VIRPAVPEDAAILLAIESSGGPTTWNEAGLRATLGQPATRALLCFEGREPVAHAVSTVAGDEAEIVLISVKPQHRRHGHASALMHSLASTWRDAGVRAAWLEVRVGNVAAIALYRLHGWVDAGIRRGYYRDGEDARIMRWNAR
jgi:ribosomal-protein-alanine N-acetyltransferase